MTRPNRKLASYVPIKPLATAILVFSLGAFSLESARAGVIAIYDFEDGTVQGWTSFNGSSSPANTTVVAFSGTHSILTSTNSAGAGGPSILLNGLFVPDEQYTITGEIRLTSGETATNANLTMKVTDPACGGGTCFETVGTFQVPVSALGFSMVGGAFDTDTTATGFLLFAQLIGPSNVQSFYLDDVVISDVGPVATPEPGAFLTISTGLALIAAARFRRHIC